ncbi:MAG: TonB-dependent receptor plug domain-containing protein [Bacteroidales bacterium]
MRKKYGLFILLAFGFLCGTAYAQDLKVTGTVTDFTDDSTLPGVTIVVKGTTTGTTTDINGDYEITVSKGDVLVFSFIGMVTEEVLIEESGEYNVALIPDITTLDEFVVIVSSVAKDRETPVAISTVSSEDIEIKLGTQEFPEMLKSTPSVYATKDGGGFGDGRINMRGFDSNNIGVLINGVPVNDMENGSVYWSNWAGLSDVTQTMQVQRGLGASRLAISSVGGTINIVTKSTDAKQGGSVSYGLGHDGYQSRSLMLSTGLLDNGWAVTALGGLRTGEGFVKGTEFEGWSYFLNLSKRINNNHTLSLTAFGAPQWHNQRWPRSYIQTYREHPDGIRYNPSIGYYKGERYATAYNQYHKPQVSLNHYWSINRETTLSTAAYISISSGGGRRTAGENSNLLRFDSNTGLPTGSLLTPDGSLDLDAVAAINAESATGSRAIISTAVNSHDWYGVLSTLQRDINNFKVTGGVDLRYYKGYHYQKVEDLLGGDYFLDVDGTSSRNINRDPNTLLYKGDIINYHNLGEVGWGGLFVQGEYITDLYSAFVSGTASNTYYRRTDYFTYEDDSPEQQTDWVDFLAWSMKGGANYNISAQHNVFVNGGYFTRAPFFRWAFIGYTNDVNEDVKYEKVSSTEVGYGFRSEIFAANVILYRTEWLDKALVRNIGEVTANITGLNALHQGVEFDFTARFGRKAEIRGMFSYGDWTWTDDVIADIYDEYQELIETVEVFAGDLSVGNSAQTTAALGVSYEVLPKLRIGFDANHYDRLFAFFDVENRTDIDEKGIDAWQLPAHQLYDAYARYNFKIAGLNATLVLNVNNLLNTEVIRDATDGSSHDYQTATVYYGWGRTWTTSVKVRF